MAHKRPIPQASQSPYPLHPAPLSHEPEPSDDDSALEEGGGAQPTLPSRKTIAGSAIGIGSAAIVAALLYWRSGRTSPASSQKPRSSGPASAKRGRSADRARVAKGQAYEVRYFAKKHSLPLGTAREIIAQSGSSRDKANALAERAKSAVH